MYDAILFSATDMIGVHFGGMTTDHVGTPYSFSALGKMRHIK